MKNDEYKKENESLWNKVRDMEIVIIEKDNKISALSCKLSSIDKRIDIHNSVNKDRIEIIKYCLDKIEQLKGI